MKNAKNKKTRKARRQYDAAFKQNALQLIEGGRSVHSVSQSLGVSEGLLYNWKSKVKQKNLTSTEPVNEELVALKKELAEVEMERDILKKALSIFSRIPDVLRISTAVCQTMINGCLCTRCPKISKVSILEDCIFQTISNKFSTCQTKLYDES